MESDEDRIAFLLEDETRLQIAQWCEAEELSREDLARRLNRPSGGLSAPTTMLNRGALRRAASRGSKGQAGRRAKRLTLDPAWAVALHEALKRRTPAVLERGTAFLLVPLAETENACRALAAGIDEIAWGARLDGEQLGLILSPHPDVDSRAMIRAVAALARAGAQPLRVQLQRPMAAAELREWAATVIEAALPRGADVGE
jgi:hypothetical protein